MRAATFWFVLAIHVVFFLVFAVLRSPTRPDDPVDAPATTFIFLPEVVKPVESVPAPAVAGRAARRAAPQCRRLSVPRQFPNQTLPASLQRPPLTGGRKPGSQPTTYWRLRGTDGSTPRYWNHMTCPTPRRPTCLEQAGYNFCSLNLGLREQTPLVQKKVSARRRHGGRVDGSARLMGLASGRGAGQAAQRHKTAWAGATF